MQFAGLTWWTRHELISSNPMHLNGARTGTERSNLVDNDVLQRNSTGKTIATISSSDGNCKDIGQFSTVIFLILTDTDRALLSYI